MTAQEKNGAIHKNFQKHNHHNEVIAINNSNILYRQDERQRKKRTILPKYKIELEEIEEKLFSLLVRASDWYNDSTSGTGDSMDDDSSSSSIKLELRVAGGWVRDKLLGLHSHDVDMAVDKMSGVEYCDVVLQYLKHLKESGQGLEDVHHKMSIINANPEQSKHLETATMKILGIDVDFVNLRAEEIYLPHSRIPHETTKFGTPLEDALRRDLTINALFYNLRTREVEDYTKRGLEDLLVNKVVETPLDPHATFHDDPLRVLRAVKFAVRFDFDIAPTLKEAALSPAVHQSLLLKVSRERVGKELSAMLIGKNANPIKALTLLAELGLAQPVFGLPVDQLLEGSILNTRYKDIPDPVRTVSSHDNVFDQAWPHASFCLSLLPSLLPHCTKQEHVTEEIMDPTMMHLSIFLCPFSDLSYMDAKQKNISLIVWMLKEGLKFKNKDVFALQLLYDHLPTMRSYLQNDVDAPPSRLQLGLLLRNLKELWRIALILATIAEMHAPLLHSNHEILQSYPNSQTFQTAQNTYMASFQNIYHCITSSYNLDNCWKIPYLINGKELLSSLKLSRGPVVGIYLEEQMKWMLSHPDGNRMECMEFMNGLRERRNLEGLDDVFRKDCRKKKSTTKKNIKSDTKMI